MHRHHRSRSSETPWGQRARLFAHWRRGHDDDHGLHHGPGRRRRYGRGERVFDQGDLRWVILQLIAQKPSHGYELIKAIEERLGGGYTPSPGVIYPTLTLLEDMGWIAAADSAGARKAFAITPEGRAALDEQAAVVEAIFKRMDETAERTRGERAPQIGRAMQNLAAALSLRLAQHRSDEEVARIVRLIDDAARAVEAGG